MPYLTPEELRITKEEYIALIKTKELLKDKIPAVQDLDSEVGFVFNEPLSPRFNMSNHVKTYSCGTACCIGGFVSLIMQGVEIGDTITVDFAQEIIANNYVWESHS